MRALIIDSRTNPSRDPNLQIFAKRGWGGVGMTLIKNQSYNWLHITSMFNRPSGLTFVVLVRDGLDVW